MQEGRVRWNVQPGSEPEEGSKENIKNGWALPHLWLRAQKGHQRRGHLLAPQPDGLLVLDGLRELHQHL